MNEHIYFTTFMYLLAFVLSISTLILGKEFYKYLLEKEREKLNIKEQERKGKLSHNRNDKQVTASELNRDKRMLGRTLRNWKR